MASNHETWLVNLWIDNEQGSYNYVNELVEESGNVYDAAQALKAEYEESTPEVSGVWSDLLNSALSAVDWVEVARQHKPDEWGDSDSAPEDEDSDEDEWEYCVAAGCWEKVTPQTGVMDHVGDWYCKAHADEHGITQHYNG